MLKVLIILIKFIIKMSVALLTFLLVGAFVGSVTGFDGAIYEILIFLDWIMLGGCGCVFFENARKEVTGGSIN